jgi:hypothetical protein
VATRMGSGHQSVRIGVCLQRPLRNPGRTGQPGRPCGEGQRRRTGFQRRPGDLHRDRDLLSGWLTGRLSTRLGNRRGHRLSHVGQRSGRGHGHRSGGGKSPVGQWAGYRAEDRDEQAGTGKRATGDHPAQCDASQLGELPTAPR